jgi:hypothetical protein
MSTPASLPAMLAVRLLLTLARLSRVRWAVAVRFLLRGAQGVAGVRR